MTPMEVALNACNKRLTDKKRADAIGDPGVRRRVAREGQWQSDYARQHNVPLVSALMVIAGETAADLYILREQRELTGVAA